MPREHELTILFLIHINACENISPLLTLGINIARTGLERNYNRSYFVRRLEHKPQIVIGLVTCSTQQGDRRDAKNPNLFNHSFPLTFIFFAKQ